MLQGILSEYLKTSFLVHSKSIPLRYNQNQWKIFVEEFIARNIAATSPSDLLKRELPTDLAKNLFYTFSCSKS